MLEAILLGILQGLTEFLPVSSSGHLVFYQNLLHVPGDALLFDLVLHLGTLAPVLFVYRDDLARMVTAPLRETGPIAERPGTRLAALIVLASVPTALIGLGLEDWFAQLFEAPANLAITFTITGFLLMATRFTRLGDTDELGMTWWQALIIGVAQGLAIAPGISRSGTTIAIALFLGMKREYAARFSFLMSVPAIGGAFLLKARDADLAQLDLALLGAGALAALVSGYLALVLLIKLVKQGDFSKFSWYVWAMAIAVLVGAWQGWI
ncbi:MAG: undecaprenyl-diphosphate phosphatase [Alphaproteobacteria bacterium]|nr:undecaprenyl-diphosphate phosphatase [Alphaproteobacteria bacterium]MCB9794734.1 undecaprenyl-diphosphate phosphatase [Alphaproteobacteria bacterium]